MPKIDKIEFTVQPAKVNDLKQIREIYQYYVEETVSSLEEKMPSEQEFLEHFESVVSRDLPFLVARDKSGKVLGFTYVQPYRKRSAYRYTLEDSIYIHKDFVGRGVGRALISEIMKKCKEVGYKQLIAVVVADDNQNSLNFHKSQGFEEKGRLSKVGFKFGKWHDILILQKSI